MSSNVSANSSAANSKPRRQNNLLRDYYGLSAAGGGAPSASGIASPSSRASSPRIAPIAASTPPRRNSGLGTSTVTSTAATTVTSSSSSAAAAIDPDSPHFDANRAFAAACAKDDIRALLGRESALLTEIRELDGERQSLVYNHHHELVSASETIRKMKSRADSLAPAFDSLRASLSAVQELGPRVQIPVHLVPATSLDLDASKSPDATAGAVGHQLRRPVAGGSGDRDAGTRSILHDIGVLAGLPQRLVDTIALGGDAGINGDGVLDTADAASLSRHDARQAAPPLQQEELMQLLQRLGRQAGLDTADDGCRGLPQAERLWGQAEDALTAWADAGVPGAREIGQQCRAILREAREKGRRHRLEQQQRHQQQQRAQDAQGEAALRPHGTASNGPDYVQGQYSQAAGRSPHVGVA